MNFQSKNSMYKINRYEKHINVAKNSFHISNQTFPFQLWWKAERFNEVFNVLMSRSKPFTLCKCKFASAHLSGPIKSQVFQQDIPILTFSSSLSLYLHLHLFLLRPIKSHVSTRYINFNFSSSLSFYFNLHFSFFQFQCSTVAKAPNHKKSLTLFRLESDWLSKKCFSSNSYSTCKAEYNFGLIWVGYSISWYVW